MSEVDLEEAIRGTTLRVYWYVLTARKPVSAREVQKHLRLSSPSVASHHLEKLDNLRLVRKDNMGQYSLVEEVRVGVLRFFIGFGRHQIPRYFFYATYFIGLLAGYLIAFRVAFDIKDIYIIVFGASSIFTSMYELASIWRMKRL